MNGLASLAQDPGPGLATLSVPGGRVPRLPVRRQLSLPVTSLSCSTQPLGTPGIPNKVSPWPLEEAETCDEETSLIDDNRYTTGRMLTSEDIGNIKNLRYSCHV